MTVRRRLLMLMLPALAILMLGGGLVDYFIAVATTRNAYDQALASMGLAIAAYLHTDDERLVFTPPMRLAGMSTVARPDNELFSIVAADGELIAGLKELPQVRAAGDTPGEAFTDADYHGRRLRLATLTTLTPLGPATITVAQTQEKRARTEWVMLYGKLLVDFAELDVTLILVWVAVYYGLLPLRRLHDELEMHGQIPLRRFDEAQVPGELRPLVRTFNRLLELLHDAAAAQRRFVADAAHQMRTPVAGLMAQLELLLDDPGAASVRNELATLNRGIVQLAHSANQLLALARAEPLSSQPEQFQPLPLQPLIEELVGRHIDRAEKLGLDLGAEAMPAEVIGDAWLLDDMVSNLIDNALKYTPRGGRVTVRCGTAGNGTAYIEVEDDGPGIPEAERSRVRERFYRRPGSVGPGCGLGLAIVDEIARVHNASFNIEAGAGGRGVNMQLKFSRRKT
jgi:two-component system sensor histidine kinase TctE